MRIWKWRIVATVAGFIVLHTQLGKAADGTDSDAMIVTREVRKILPAGWNCTVTTAPQKMGHPHGLKEPAFRLDITNPSLSFRAEHGAISKGSLHPYLRLHFHPRAQQAEVEQVVKSEQVFSWDIPTTFALTADHIVVTSPAWINHGYHTKNAQAAIAPLLSALSGYFGPTDTAAEDKADVRSSADFEEIKPGMTRREVERAFAKDGGLSGASPVRFVHPRIENLKIDVHFDFRRNAADQGRAITSPDDTVVSKSKAYQQVPFSD